MIAIIGVLATIVFTIVNPVAQFQKAQDARRKNDLEQIQRALEVYYQDKGSYPQSDNSSYTIINTGSTGIPWGTVWPGYMSTLPKDPNANQNYVYYTPSGNQSYFLYASLERGINDAQTCKNSQGAAAACPNVPAGQTCGAVCDYGISSSNTSP